MKGKIGVGLLLLTVIGGILFWPASRLDADVRKLYIYNWSEYMPSDILEAFTDETGIEVILTTYDSNESMYAKLKMLDATGYDLVVPSSYFVSKLRDEKLIRPLDKSRIDHLENLSPLFLNKDYDPNNTYSLPYLWGATAIGVNAEFIDPNSITSWRDLWNPKYRGQILLMNDVREVFHIALRSLGYSANSKDPKEINAAYQSLQQLMPNVAVFNSDTPERPYLSEDVYLGMLWNGSAYKAIQDNPNIKLIYPKEGAVLWMDNLAIPQNAKNIDEAYVMINYLLRPDIAAKISAEIGYPTPNHAAKDIMDASFANNEVIFPPTATIQAGEFQSTVGEANPLYNEYWQKLKTQQ
jgi:spermidine/putrescine transport system substrate-binding protein